MTRTQMLTLLSFGVIACGGAALIALRLVLRAYAEIEETLGA